ncbi:MAG: hypothetical protein JNN08_15235 [Bryobacterales bacterium]|nr:hypothetical protein [Bryobacterales bacterium]
MWKCGFAVSLLGILCGAFAQRVVSTSRTPVMRGEVDSDQVGSANRGVRRPEMGVLRCQAGEAWVALKIKRGNAIDGVQIGCAPVQCGNGGCRWSSASWAGMAGRFHSGGNVEIHQSCPAGMLITGFRAESSLQGMYAYDLQIECGRMAGHRPTSFVTGYTDIPVTPGNRSLANRYDGLTRRALAPVRPEVSASCPDAGSTALSYAMGTYSPMRIPVVQTISIYCLSATSSTSQGDPELKSLTEELKQEIEQLKQNCAIAADHFFFSYADVFLSTLEYLNQPYSSGQFGLGAPAQNLLNAVANPAELFNSTINGAVQAVQLFQRDPSSFFGQQAAALTPAKALQLAKTGTRNLIQYARESRAAAYGAKQPIGNQRINGPYCSPFNPFGGCANCVRVAHAFDQSLALKTPIRAMPTLPMSNPDLQTFLLNTYARRQLNPLHGTFGTFAHRFGLPVPTNELRLTGAMQAMGEGARGFVFFKPHAGGIGHVVNIFVKNGQVYLYDAQAGRRTFFHMWTSSHDLLFYRTN